MSRNADAMKALQREKRSAKSGAAGDKPVTVRLSDDVLRLLDGLCIIDDTSLAEQLRTAVVSYLETRRKSPEIRNQLAEARLRQLEALDAWAEDDEGTTAQAPS
jgi:hypothetical protein